MNYELYYGKPKRRSSTAKRSKSPKRSKSSGKKLSKKMLDRCTLKCLQKLAKKYRISVNKKGSKTKLSKKQLLTKLKKSRSINKILKSAKAMKKRKSKFGSPKNDARNALKAGYPPLTSPMDISSGKTALYRMNHYKALPASFLSFNYQKNLKFPNTLYSSNSMYQPANKFGQYFR